MSVMDELPICYSYHELPRLPSPQRPNSNIVSYAMASKIDLVFRLACLEDFEAKTECGIPLPQ